MDGVVLGNGLLKLKLVVMSRKASQQTNGWRRCRESREPLK